MSGDVEAFSMFECLACTQAVGETVLPKIPCTDRLDPSAL